MAIWNKITVNYNKITHEVNLREINVELCATGVSHVNDLSITYLDLLERFLHINNSNLF